MEDSMASRVRDFTPELKYDKVKIVDQDFWMSEEEYEKF